MINPISPIDLAKISSNNVELDEIDLLVNSLNLLLTAAAVDKAGVCGWSTAGKIRVETPGNISLEECAEVEIRFEAQGWGDVKVESFGCVIDLILSASCLEKAVKLQQEGSVK